MSETVVDLKQLREMLHHFDTLHIAFQDDEYPYIVPMNFGIGDDEDKIVLYIYTPREGKMTRLIKENPHVGIQAETLYEYFCNQCELNNIEVQKGIFGADMKVELINDGPVTIIIEK